jgi:uncharacterized phage protein (TIGR02218 family)
MTYDARERSADQARPVELYTFNRDYIAWRYTSADADRVIDFITYTRAPIRRSDIEQGQELNRSSLKLRVPRDFEVAALYAISPPSDTITLTLRQYHEGDAEVATNWTGRILSVRFDGSEAEITLEPLQTSIRRNGLRRYYQRMCPHVLYGAGCGLNRSAFRLVATADTVAGIKITATEIATQPDGYWTGGYVEWAVATGIFDRRYIIAHAGPSIDLDTAPVGLAPGMQMNIYPGCDRSLATCHSKFGNEENHGGMPYMPLNNPFGNEPLY